MYSGFTEDQIDNFSYVRYIGLIRTLAMRVQFESMSNLLGRSYGDEKTLKIVEGMNPMNCEEKKVVSKPRPTLNMMKNFGLV